MCSAQDVLSKMRDAEQLQQMSQIDPQFDLIPGFYQLQDGQLCALAAHW
jgi:hypothetical protein